MFTDYIQVEFLKLFVVLMHLVNNMPNMNTSTLVKSRPAFLMLRRRLRNGLD